MIEKILNFFKSLKPNDAKTFYGVYKEKSKKIPTLNLKEKDIIDVFSKFNEIIKERNILIENFSLILIVGKYSEGKKFLVTHNTNEEFSPDSILENELISIHIKNESILFYLNQDIFNKLEKSKESLSNINIVLNNLKKMNETKPLTSIILRVPIPLLKTTEALDDNAELFKNNLKFIQSSIGLKVPVYVFISEMENIYGFNKFMSLLTLEERKKFIIGWSNHYGIENVFQEKMFDESYENILNTIRDVISSKILLNTDNIWNEDIYNFPHELSLTLKNIKNFINIIFHETSSINDYFFRGIYLTGLNLEPDNLPSGLEKDELMQNIIISKKTKKNGSQANFTKNFLFDNVIKFKIFPEKNLCTADTQHFLKIKKFSDFIKISAILLFSFLSINSIVYFYKLNSKVPEVVSAIDKTSFILIDKYSLLPGFLESKTNRPNKEILFSLNEIDDAFNLLNNSYNINFKNYFIPWTFSSQISSYFNRYITKIIYIYFIFPTRERIIKKSKELTQTSGKLTDGLYNSLENTNKFIASVEKFEKWILDFNRIEKEFNNENILDLMTEILNFDFSNFRKKYYFTFYNLGSENKFPIINLKEFRDPFNKTFENLINILSYNIEKDSRIFEIIKELIQYIDFPDSKVFDENYLEYINNISTLIKNFNFLFNLNETNKISIDYVQKSELLRISFLKYIDKIKKSVEKRNKFMISLRSNVLKELFMLDGDKIKTSENFDTLSKSIINYQNEPIYSQSFTRLDKLFFNENDLPELYSTLKAFKEISQYNRFYYNFVENGLKNYPTYIQYFLKMASINSIISKINKNVFLENKNIYQTNDIIPSNIGEISSNYLIFVDTIKILKELNTSNNTYLLLNKMFSNSIIKYFGVLKTDLDSKGFYNYKNNSFNWWKGEIPPIFEAFTVTSQRDLEDYLYLKNEEVKNYITRNVKPLFGILNSFSNISESFNIDYLYWTNTIADIEGKSKSNNFKLFNELIINKLSILTKDNCMKVLSEYEKNKIENEYYINQIENIYSSIFFRCKEIQFSLFVKDYREFESFFNLQISGKFPFSRGLPNKKENELDLNLLLELYQKYERMNRKYPVDLIKSLNNQTNLDDQFNFIDRLRRIFDFFDFSNNKDLEFKGISLNLSINYRPDLSIENMTNSLAEREIEISGNKISNTLGNTNIIWKYASPISVSFRWSKDYNIWPTNTDQNNSLFITDVNDKKITFIFQNKWSLFYLLRKYSTDNGKNINSQVTFEIPIYIKNKPNSKDQNFKNDIAVAAIKITPFKIASRENLNIPSFPVTCPEIDFNYKNLK